MKLLAMAVAIVVLVLSMNAGTALAQYASPGTIEVSPPTPAPGEVVTVAVTGCEPAPGSVDVLIDGVFVGEGDVAADGTFTEDFVVPLEAEGEVLVQVMCSAGILSSVVDVRIVDLPFLDPDTGANALPRTGSNSTIPLAQAGVALLGIGAVLVLLVARRNEPGKHSALGVQTTVAMAERG